MSNNPYRYDAPDTQERPLEPNEVVVPVVNRELSDKVSTSMTYREWAAGIIMASILRGVVFRESYEMAEIAVEAADALITSTQ